MVSPVQPDRNVWPLECDHESSYAHVAVRDRTISLRDNLRNVGERRRPIACRRVGRLMALGITTGGFGERKSQIACIIAQFGHRVLEQSLERRFAPGSQHRICRRTRKPGWEKCQQRKDPPGFWRQCAIREIERCR